MKNEKSQIRILAEVLYRYIFKVSKTRKILLPILAIIILSRWLEIQALSYSSKLGDFGNPGTLDRRIYDFSLFILVSVLFSFLFELVCFVFSPLLQRAYRIAAKDSFSYFMNLDYIVFASIGSGEIHNTVERKSKAVSDILEIMILEVIPVLCTIMFTSLKLFTRLGVIIPAIMVLSYVPYLFITVIMTERRSRLRKKVNYKLNEQSNSLYDTLINYEAVLAYNNRNLEIDRFDKKVGQTEVVYVELYRTLYILNFLQRLCFIAQMFIEILFGIYGILVTKFDDESYKLYLGIIRSIAGTTYKAGFLYNKYSMAIVSYREEYPRGVRQAGRQDCRFDNTIEFRDVKILYGDKYILENINLVIKKGEKIAIVGRNGTGKSSMAKVILGFVAYTGNIYIDDVNFKEISIDGIRNMISYIHQDSALFHDTVQYNIAYGNKKASLEEIIEACKRIKVHDSLKALANGYQTNVGEKGSSLSGGERQKVAFARAAVKNASVFILDEPTASLDVEAEFVIINQIIEHFEDKTLIMIVHNLSMLDKFDKVFFIGKNNFSRVGKFDELLENCEEFRQFYGHSNNQSIDNKVDA